MLASARYIQAGSSISELLEKIYAAVDTFYTYPKIKVGEGEVFGQLSCIYETITTKFFKKN